MNVLLKLDKVIVRVLATLQLLAPGLCFLAVLFALNYWGAASKPAAPPLISVYSIFGVVSALHLYSAHTYTRLLASIWHGILERAGKVVTDIDNRTSDPVLDIPIYKRARAEYAAVRKGSTGP